MRKPTENVVNKKSAVASTGSAHGSAYRYDSASNSVATLQTISNPNEHVDSDSDEITGRNKTVGSFLLNNVIRLKSFVLSHRKVPR